MSYNLENLIDQINKMDDKALSCLHRTKSQLIEDTKKENSAINICGAQLGNCYILSEVIHSYMFDYLEFFKKKRKWFRFTVKKEANLAFSLLDKSLVKGRALSGISYQLIADTLDTWDQCLNPHIQTLFYTTKNQLGTEKMSDEEREDLTMILIIGLLLNMDVNMYFGIIDNMKKYYDKIDYDSWFDYAKQNGALDAWQKFLDLYVKNIYKGADEVKDIISNEQVKLSLQVIQQAIIHSSLKQDSVLEKAKSIMSDEELKEIDSIQEKLNNDLAVIGEPNKISQK